MKPQYEFWMDGKAKEVRALILALQVKYGKNIKIKDLIEKMEKEVERGINKKNDCRKRRKTK